MRKKKSIGSSFNKFLHKQGAYETTQAIAIKKVLTWQIEQAMKRRHIAKAEMARLMRTSRSQLDRLLDPTNGSVTLSTLARASHVLGKEIRLQLVEA